jgi:membrane complex biogenesis BtpA family protein
MATFREIFGPGKPLIGMVHLQALPGAPRYCGDLDAIERRAVNEARILKEEGFDGIVVENFGDVPFFPGSVDAATVATMTRMVLKIREATGLPLGVNVLRNDATAAMAIALATEAEFIRTNVHIGATVTDQGLIQGRAHETVRDNLRLGAKKAIFADVLVKHGTPLGDRDPAQVARDTVERGLADAVLVTGAATGSAVDPDLLTIVRQAVPDTPLLIASGLTPRNARKLLPLSDGAIVGTALKRGGVPGARVDRRRARRMAEAWREAKV